MQHHANDRSWPEADPVPLNLKVRLAEEDVGVPDIVRYKITGASPHCVYSKLRNKS